MSGKNWCPAGTPSTVTTGVDQESPFGELRAKIFACPSPSLALQTTCTPSASAATAERLEKRAYVSALGHANGPSPQVSGPKSVESNGSMDATVLGELNDWPPSVERTMRMRFCVGPWWAISR